MFSREKGLGRKGIDWEVATDMYTLPERTQPTHKDLLYGTGDSAQYSVTAYPGKESKKEWTHM